MSYEFNRPEEQEIWNHLIASDPTSPLRGLNEFVIDDAAPLLPAAVAALALAVNGSRVIAVCGPGSEVHPVPDNPGDVMYSLDVHLLTEEGIYSSKVASLSDYNDRVAVAWTPWSQVSSLLLESNASQILGETYPSSTHVSFELPDGTRLTVGGRHRHADNVGVALEVFKIIQMHTGG